MGIVGMTAYTKAPNGITPCSGCGFVYFSYIERITIKIKYTANDKAEVIRIEIIKSMIFIVFIQSLLLCNHKNASQKLLALRCIACHHLVPM